MKSILGLYLCLWFICLCQCENNVDGNQLNSTDPDEDEVHEYPELNTFLMKIKANGMEYTGIKLGANVLVTDPAAIANDTVVCFLENSGCMKPNNMTVINNIAFFNTSYFVGEPPRLKQEIDNSTNCTTVSLKHGYISGEIDNVYRFVNCTGCERFDAVICGYKLAGIAAKYGEQLSIIVIRQDILRKWAYMNDLTFDETFKEVYDEPISPPSLDTFMLVIKANGNIYTGLRIATSVLVTDPAAITNDTVVCLTDDICWKPTNATIINNLGFVKSSFFVSRSPILQKTDSTTNCTASSFKHEYLSVKVENHKLLNCTNCDWFDAVICDYKLAGIVKGHDELELIDIGSLRKWAYDRYLTYDVPFEERIEGFAPHHEVLKMRTQ